MVTVTVWIVMAVSAWSYEGVLHEGSWPNTNRLSYIVHRKSVKEINLPAMWYQWRTR